MIRKIVLPWVNAIKLHLSNWSLFLLLLLTLFVLPLFSSLFIIDIFDICLTLVIGLSVFATSESQRPIIAFQVFLAILALWITKVIDLPILSYLGKLILVIFFLTRVFKFIKQVSIKQEVKSVVIIEAVNGYLLLGVAFGVLIEFLVISHPGSFNFIGDNVVAQFYDPYYYSFVTLSTLGYGDLLPQAPPAKAIAIFITLCGQFYLVTIMAFLIGRLLSKSDNSD